jgi:predicted phosphodiesterase
LRIAVFSDLHGNQFAAQALLNAISQHAPDAIVAAGDICLGGARPAACVDLLMQAGVLAVMGNTETYLRAPDATPPDDAHRRKWHWIQPAVLWTLMQLTQAQHVWLTGLPFDIRFSPTSSAEDDLLVVHANPRNVEDNLLPPIAVQQRLWGQVRQPDNDPTLLHLLDGVQAHTLAFGHFHLPSRRAIGRLRLVNVASASLPGVDHARCARWSLFTWDGRTWQIEQFELDYGVEQEIEALRQSDNPSKDQFLPYFG